MLPPQAPRTQPLPVHTLGTLACWDYSTLCPLWFSNVYIDDSVTLWRGYCDGSCRVSVGVVATDMFYDFVGSGEGLADMFKPLAVRIDPAPPRHSIVSSGAALPCNGCWWDCCSAAALS